MINLFSALIIKWNKEFQLENCVRVFFHTVFFRRVERVPVRRREVPVLCCCCCCCCENVRRENVLTLLDSSLDPRPNTITITLVHRVYLTTAFFQQLSAARGGQRLNSCSKSWFIVLIYFWYCFTQTFLSRVRRNLGEELIRGRKKDNGNLVQLFPYLKEVSWWWWGDALRGRRLLREAHAK